MDRPIFGLTPSARETLELERTRDALVREVDELVRKKSSLEAELDVLYAADATVLVRAPDEATGAANRRFFVRFVEREIHRVEREIDGRFSIARLAVRDNPPGFFPDFLLSSVRLSDLVVRAGPRLFLLYLHGAGGLGRRLFAHRLAKNIAIALEHHHVDMTVALGAATFPVDGTAVDELLALSLERLKKLEPKKPRDLFRAEPRRRSADPLSLEPPEGARVALGPDRADSVDVLRAVEDAAKNQRSGELVVRSGDVVGRVYLHDGAIAWAHASTRALSLAEHLVKSCGIDAEEIRFAFEHCRASGANFAETLIELGTFERETMRSILRTHLRAHLEGVLALPAPDVLFLPQSRKYQSDLTFALDELLPPGVSLRTAAIVDALRERVPAVRPERVFLTGPRPR